MIRTAFSRLRALFGRNQLKRELDDEVQAHLDLLARDYARGGMTPEQARHAARRVFGGVEQMKETYRDRRGLPWLADARRDVLHALRSLRRAPMLAGAAVLTLAVGMSAVGGIFAVPNAFMFRPMPVSHPEQLVSLGTGPDSHVPLPHGISFRDLQDYRDRQNVFTDLLGYAATVGALNVGNVTVVRACCWRPSASTG